MTTTESDPDPNWSIEDGLIRRPSLILRKGRVLTTRSPLYSTLLKKVFAFLRSHQAASQERIFAEPRSNTENSKAGNFSLDEGIYKIHYNAAIAFYFYIMSVRIFANREQYISIMFWCRITNDKVNWRGKLLRAKL